MEITQEQLDEIARLIKEGCTSGRIDDEGTKCSWQLNTEIWKD